MRLGRRLGRNEFGPVPCEGCGDVVQQEGGICTAPRDSLIGFSHLVIRQIFRLLVLVSLVAIWELGSRDLGRVPDDVCSSLSRMKLTLVKSLNKKIIFTPTYQRTT